MKMKLITLLASTFLVSQLSACGFQLRGYNSPMSQGIPTTDLIFGNKAEDYAVKNALKHQLEQLNITTEDVKVQADNPQAIQQLPVSIEVKNIRLQNYQLRGILTEIRMVLSADVTYHTLQNGQPKTLTNTLQVQRSYQYDQATVATDNPQAEQIKVWLYDNLAQRIADQYLAFSLPRVTSITPPSSTTAQPK